MALTHARITNQVCQSTDTLHNYLKDSLKLPAYYGRNLSALADCLAETGKPLLVTFALNISMLSAEMQAYALKLVQVCAREALMNEKVSLIIEHGELP